MSNIFGNLPAIKDIFNWFKDYYETPEGKRAIIVIVSSLAFGFYYGSVRYEHGMAFQKKEDSLTIARIEKSNLALIAEKQELQKKSDIQQEKLENRDCTDEVMRYRTLFESLKSETAQSARIVIAQKNKEVQERKQNETILKADQEKTKELTKIKNTLK